MLDLEEALDCDDNELDEEDDELEELELDEDETDELELDEETELDEEDSTTWISLLRSLTLSPEYRPNGSFSSGFLKTT